MVAGAFLRELATWGLSDPRARRQRWASCVLSEGFSLSFGLVPPLGAGAQHRHPTAAVILKWACEDVPGDQPGRHRFTFPLRSGSGRLLIESAFFRGYLDSRDNGWGPAILSSVSAFLPAPLMTVILFLGYPGHAEKLGVGLSYVWEDRGKRFYFNSPL